MIYKVKGETGRGRASCGHIVRANEEYYIIRRGRDLLSVCKACCKGFKTAKTVSPDWILENLK